MKTLNGSSREVPSGHKYCIVRMENGHTPVAQTVASLLVRESILQANGCGQGCNGSTCQTCRRQVLPRLGKLTVQAYTAILSTTARRHLSALERKMCFKCKTSKAEVGYCVALVSVHRDTCVLHACQALIGAALTGAGVGEAARASVLGLFSFQLGEDCQAYHTDQMSD